VNRESQIVNCDADVVVKLGGGLLAHPAHFDAVLEAISDAADERRLLVVPGGGPFADTVRQVDRQFALSDDAAHWMAVLAMDQYAHLITSRLAASTLVVDPGEIAAALGAARLPVLAPSRWLREADPLPHTWDVTSDSIAAWVAGVVRARRLVLVKPPGVGASDSVDGYFNRALPAHVTPAIVPADRTDALRAALRA
jgi:5-(aminomethyl)-3-furanmethanol phosphate kinase